MYPSIDARNVCAAGSVTIQLAALKKGDSGAQEWIFARLLPEVLTLARKRIGSCPSRYHDEYDLAIEVLGVVLMRANSFDQLQNRWDLTRLLNKLVKYKSIDAYRRMRRRRRVEVGESWITNGAQSEGDARRTQINELSAAAVQTMAVDLFDSLMHTIRTLKDDELQCQQILKLLLEGYRVAEISQIVGRGERSIYRLLERIESEFVKSANALAE